MKKNILTLIIVLLSAIANAQQIGAFSHGFFKPMIYNPAFTGSTGFENAMIISRNQWSGFKGAPKLNVFIFDGNLKSENIGLGIGLISDKKGINNRVGGNISYSYRIKINDDTHLSFGVSAGVINQTLDYSKIVVANENDPSMFTDVQRKIGYDASAGLAFNWKEFDLGLSVPQIIGNSFKYKSDTASATYLQNRHYVGFLRYKIYLEEEKGISIIPQSFVRMVPNAPMQYDGTVNFDWNDKFWVGATYKSNYAVAANIGVCIKKHFQIGYSYDFIIGSISKYAGMSHEIMLNFKFGSKKEEAKKTLAEKEPQPELEKKEVAKVEPETEEQKTLPDLNTLLLLNLIKEIEAILDNPNATVIQILDLKNRISMFSNSDFADAAMKERVSQYTGKLNLPTEKNPDIVVKGSIILEGDFVEPNYSMVTITVVAKQNEETVGTYTPNSRTGKFLLILRPDEKYQIIVENDDYQIHTEDLSYPGNTEVKEFEKAIRLKK